MSIQPVAPNEPYPPLTATEQATKLREADALGAKGCVICGQCRCIKLTIGSPGVFVSPFRCENCQKGRQP